MVINMQVKRKTSTDKSVQPTAKTLFRLMFKLIKEAAF